MTNSATVSLVDPQDLVGVRTTSDDFFQIGREEARKFAQAASEASPLCWNAAEARAAGHPAPLVPLTFAALMGGPMAQNGLLPPQYSLSQVLHVEQRNVYHRPMYVGARIWRVSGLESFRPSDRADQLVIKTDFVDESGEVLQEVWVTLLARAGAADPAVAAAAEKVMLVVPSVDPGRTAGPEPSAVHLPLEDLPPGPAVADAATLAAGQILDQRTYQISRGNLVAYSGVAGDPNPIHFSDEMARRAGLETVVAQAMLTMAMGGSYLTRLVGDPSAVREYRARFSNPIYVQPDAPAEVTFGGKVKTFDAGRKRAELALTAVHNGRRVFGKAIAVVDLR
ncbi:MaoC family dehydratase N-terminal domain-containing protein [Gordonia sp. VNK21]|uniref:FAS1-like dehydratase domain-containing protein n=1 Tax=Gordonia sp. VNK21 TaxID=3382483 RepID=UPI0038D4C6E3